MGAIELTVQKEGHAKLSGGYVNGICQIVDQAGRAKLAKSMQSTVAGTVYVRMNKDYDSAGAKVYKAFALEAAPENDGSGNYECPAVFDEIREEGTTIPLANLTAWL